MAHNTDFCARLRGLHPKGEFVVNTAVRVVHRNEMKGQGVVFDQNKAAYARTWGKHPHFS